MFEKLQELYCQGRLTDAGLDCAVSKGWITAGQAVEIKALVKEEIEKGA